MSIDHALVRSLIGDPMDKNEWRKAVRAHRRALSKMSYGRWEVLVAAGIPMGAWTGPTIEGQMNLGRVNLIDADAEFAPLNYAALVGVLAEDVSFRGASLKNACLCDSFLDGADFSLGKMEDADLSRASLRGAKFNKALLIGADFEDCDLTGADFSGANLERASFHNAILDGVKGYSLPIFDGDAKSELDTIMREFKDWTVAEAFEDFTRRHDHATLYSCLFDVLEADPQSLTRSLNLWKPLTEEAAAPLFTAARFIDLAKAVAEGAPDGRVMFGEGGGWSNLWGDDEIPGRPWALVSILRHKHAAQDDAFFDTIAEAFKSFPAPYAEGLMSVLVEFGRMPSSVLSEACLKDAVKRFVSGNRSTSAPKQAVWPDEQWQAAIQAQTRSAAGPVSPSVLRSMAEHTPLAELADFATTTPFEGLGLWEVIEAVASQGEAKTRVSIWEDAIERAFAPEKQVSLLAVIALMKACSDTDQAPRESLDETLVYLLRTYVPTFAGGGFQLFHDRLRAFFDVVPIERRERLVLAAGEDCSWYLAPIASTAAVGQMIATRLAKMGKMQSVAPEWMDQKDFEHRLIGTDPGMYGTGTLHAFGPEVLLAFGEVLGPKFVQRHLLVAALARTDHADALPGLEVALGDSSSVVRGFASAGFATKPQEAALKTLQSALGARKKSTRLAAAIALTKCPSSDGRAKVAKEKLAKEKVADVKVLLEKAI